LRKFIVEFKNSEYFKEISSILDKKENTINAITLFEEIEKLIKLEKREEAEAKIYIYQAKFQDKKQKYDSEIDAFKIQLNKWKKEDSDFEDILNTTNSNSQKMKCHVFLGNPDYIKKRKDVDDILNHRYSQKLALSTSSNIIPNDKVDSSLFTNYSAILKVIVFLFILILVFLGLILFQLLYS
jgi:DNA-directed RNA polymerase beta' subunit